MTINEAVVESRRVVKLEQRIADLEAKRRRLIEESEKVLCEHDRQEIPKYLNMHGLRQAVEECKA